MKVFPRLALAFALIVTLAQFAPSPRQHVSAQGDESTLIPDTPTIITLTAGQPVTRTFEVSQGSAFALRLTRLTDFPFSAVLLEPGGATVPLSPGPDGNVAYDSGADLPAGPYTLLVQSAVGGDMLAQLSFQTAAPEPLAFGLTVVDLTDAEHRYALAPPPELPDPTELIIDTLPYDMLAPLTLPAVMVLDVETGETVFSTVGGRVPRMTAILPPGQSFVLVILPGDQPLAVNINWNPIPDVVITPPPGSASATQTPTSSSGSGSGGGSCTLAFDGPVNVRSGPSTTTGIIGGVSAGDTLPVTGRSADGKWWQVNYNGQTGWVSAGLLQIDPQGACDAVPTAGTPAPGQTYTPQYTYTPTVTGTPPTATYTYTPPPYTYTPTYTPPAVTYTPTYTPPADQVAPTYTYTPSYTPTFQQPTHTYTPSYTPTTPPAAQIAPPDSNYAFNVALDTTGSFTEFVSYPGGDTQDRVGYTVTGMNPNVAFSGGRARLVIAASCFGNGLEYVQFFTAGNTFGCGQTILDTEITYEQRTGLVTINAVGGEGTYVQWVVTISVTRIN